MNQRHALVQCCVPFSSPTGVESARKEQAGARMGKNGMSSTRMQNAAWKRAAFSIKRPPTITTCMQQLLRPPKAPHCPMRREGPAGRGVTPCTLRGMHPIGHELLGRRRGSSWTFA